jgi:hypothetical protein
LDLTHKEYSMGTIGGKGGQRGNLSSGSGRKQRSPTSKGQSASRSDPSHTNEQSKADRSKKPAAAKSSAKKTTSAPSKKSGSKKS